MTLIRTDLAGGSIDEEAAAAGAGEADVIETGANDAGGALGGVGRVADGAVEGSAGEALESFGGLQIEAAVAGAGSVVRVVDQTSVGVAVYAYWRISLHVNSSQSRASSRAASGGRIIGASILIDSEIGPDCLVESRDSGRSDAISRSVGD